ncbi:MAG: hypothetical protein J0L69_05220 [Bacteroidetes bacterium]|nr:hypothetical protein [Bacteroidota bacterium]
MFITIFLAIISYYRLKKWEYIPSGTITSLLLLYLLFYSYYRLYNHVWEFTPFVYLPKAKYLDVIALIPICNCFIWVAHWVKCEKKTDKSKNSLFDDSPIEQENNDLLGYNKYAISLASKIEASTFDKSFAIGINGYWGIGKTSFINLLRKNLKTEDKVFVEFNPWDCKTPDAIIQDFFETFQESIRPYHSSLARQLLKYSSRLVKSQENSITNTLHIATSALNGIDSIESLYKKINEALKQINKKVIVIIDDLDRLDFKEITEVLKLIRNTANFYNTFFIVAYDRNYVVNSLKGLEIHKPQHFLEKIFQIEVTLPQFDKIIFRRKLVDLIKPHIRDEFHKSVEESIVGTAITKPAYLDKWLTSMRDVTRLANSLVINYGKLQGEVEFDEFLRLEILHLNYPTIYEALFRRKDEMLDTKDKSQKRTYVLRKINEQNKPTQYAIESFLSNECDEDGVNKCEIQDVLSLIKGLFPDDNYAWSSSTDFLSVVYPSNFSRYFNFELLKEDLSEVDFSKARKSSYSIFKNKIDEWVEQGLEYLIRERFANISEFDDKEDFEKIISLILYFARKETKKDKSYSTLIGYDSNDLQSKLGQSSQKKYYNYTDGGKDFKKFVLHQFLKNPPYEIEAAIINDWLSHWPDDFVLPFDYGERLVCYYFARHIRKMEKMDRSFWYFFHCCKYTKWVPRDNSGTRDGYKTVFDKAKEIVKEFVLTKDLEGFLVAIIEHNWRGDDDNSQFAVSDTVRQVWDSWQSFKDFIYSLNITSEKLDEFKTFFEKFEKTQFKKYVEFDFKTIPVRKRG